LLLEMVTGLVLLMVVMGVEGRVVGAAGSNGHPITAGQRPVGAWRGDDGGWWVVNSCCFTF